MYINSKQTKHIVNKTLYVFAMCVVTQRFIRARGINCINPNSFFSSHSWILMISKCFWFHVISKKSSKCLSDRISYLIELKRIKGCSLRLNNALIHSFILNNFLHQVLSRIWSRLNVGFKLGHQLMQHPFNKKQT